jgi:multiple sugar transport system substrate-binding protein
VAAPDGKVADMRGIKWSTCTILGLVLMPALAGTAQAETTLNALFMAQAGYSETDVRKMTDDFTKQHPDIKVNLEFVPFEALHDKIVLSKGSSQGYDVVLFDVIWPAEFAANGILMDVTDRIDPKTRDAIGAGAWTTATYQGRYYGMPWSGDSKYLFYNKEILQKAGIDHPPVTWQEVVEDAEIIKQKGLLEHPIVWSWSQNEALICDYTILLSAFGGSFTDAEGKPTFQTGGGIDALNFMVETQEKGVTNPNSLEYLEEDVRRVFSSGQAAFALNWGYMWEAANNNPQESQVTGKVGVIAPPGVAGRSEVSSVNGAMGLGIPTGSQHPDEAWAYISYLTSQPVQEQFAGSSLPIWTASLQKPEILKGREELVEASRKAVATLFPRPQVVEYQRFSLSLQEAIHQALFGNVEPAAALEAAAEELAAQ